MATDANFSNLIVDRDVGSATSFDVSSYIGNYSAFYWRVKAGNTSGWSAYASPWTFSVPGNCRLAITSFTSSRSILDSATDTTTFSWTFTDTVSDTKSATITIGSVVLSASPGATSLNWSGRDASNVPIANKSYLATLHLSTASCDDYSNVPITVAGPILPDSDMPGSCNSLAIQGGSNINLMTGNLAHSQELFATKGRTLSTVLDLYYNSKTTTAGVLGPGWRHSYESSLTFNADNSITANNSDGGSQLYTPKGGGAYNSQLGDSSTLVKNYYNLYVITYHDGSKDTFSTQGKLIQTEDRFGNMFLFTEIWNDTRYLIDSVNGLTTLGYSNGKLIWVKDPNQNQYDFEYYGDGRLWRVKNPVADPAVTTVRGYWEYTYENGRLKTKKDPEGNIFEYGYDANGRVATIKDPEWQAGSTGHSRSYTYPVNVNSVDSGTVTEKDSGTWTYLIDGSNRALRKRFDPSGVETSYTYYAEGLIKSKTDLVADGNRYTTFYKYYDNGNLERETVPTDLTKLTPPINPETVLDPDTLPIYNGIDYYYGTYDRMTQILDYRGDKTLTTSFFRDLPWPLQGGGTLNLDSYLDPELNETDYIYNSNGSINSIHDGNTNVTNYTYYANGLLESITGPDVIVYKIVEYDNNGNIKKTTTTGSSGGVKTVDYTYTALNGVKSRTTSSTNMAAETVNYTYDQNGRLASATDSATRFVRYKYTYEGRFKEVTDTLLNKATFDYAGTGCATCRDGGTSRLKTVKDEKQQTTTYQFDTRGNLEREIDPLGKIIRYTYYPNSKLKEKIDASATPELMLATYGYDKEGRISSAGYYDGGYESYTYDGWGRMRTAANNNIGYTFEYYDNNSLKSVTDSNGKKVTYDEYDGIGQLVQFTLQPDSANKREIINTYFTANNRLGWINVMGRNGSDPQRIFSFNYDTYGRRSYLGYPHSTSTTYEYDDLDRIKKVNQVLSGTPESVYLCSQFDAAGNCLANIGSKPITYVYDDLYRLTFAYGTSNYEEFGYDAAGNRTKGPGQGDTGYTPTAANQVYQGREFRYEYDSNGNQKTRITPNASDKNEVRSFDANNRLVKVERSKVTPNGIDKRTVTFKCDPLGRRIEKSFVNTVNGRNSTETYSYTYDREDLIQEIYTRVNVSGTTTSTTNYIHGPGTDEPLAMERDGVWYYFHADNLGSIVKITDANRNVVQSYGYDSYGMLKPSTTFRNSITYTGREWDKETGLYYYRGRYYDPLDGVFIGKDPLGFAGGDTNLYRYVQNRPVNYIDPYGLQAITAVPGILPIFIPPGSVFDSGSRANAAFAHSATRLIKLFDPRPLASAIAGLIFKDWEGDKGAAEWGRRKGVGAQEGKRRFHKGVKGKCKGTGATEDLTVDPDTGDVRDSEGNTIGNLGDVRAK